MQTNLNGTLFQRYYGVSLPFGKLSFSKANIGFLGMEQALADYAVLLKGLGKLYGFSASKIVSFGGRFIFIS